MERGYRPDLIAMQGLGYKELLAHFLGDLTREETITLLKRDTRRYAKRQFTWFRREPDSCWLDITGVDDPVEIAGRIKKNIEISNDLV